MNFSKTMLIAFMTVALVTSCSSDDDNSNPIPPEKPQTITDFVMNNDDYSSLAAALDAADLSETLDGDDEYTVFAPNNDAFAEFLKENNFASLGDVPKDVLKQVLLNHVQGGDIMASDLSTGYLESMATGNASDKPLSLYINTDDDVMLNGAAKVTSADNKVDNGIIHAVDKVIPLPTVVTFATADPNFSTLVAALTRDDQPDFVNILSTPTGTDPAPFTVFAPTNDAFASLLDELNADDLSDIDGATLTATLNMHVIAGANIRASDLMDGDVSTLGGDITVNAENATLTDPNDRTSHIILSDVQATNGVVHAIDKVLLPLLQ